MSNPGAAIEREGIKKGIKEGIKKGFELGMAKGHDKGLAEGHSKGLAEGRSKGLAEGIFSSISNLMESMDISAEQAMTMLKVPEDDKEIYLNMLKNQTT